MAESVIYVKEVLSYGKTASSKEIANILHWPSRSIIHILNVQTSNLLFADHCHISQLHWI